MRKIIAKIGLTRGQVGFYDPLTNIHLTITKPFADIYQGMNTSRIRASIKSGRLKLVSGCLDPIELKEDNTTQPKATTDKKVETKQEVKEEVVVAKEEIKQEKVIEETPVITEVKEEVVEEIKQEVKEETEVKPKTEKKSKKKSKKTEEVKNEDNIEQL